MNLNSYFQDGVKEVIKNPEKYGLTKSIENKTKLFIKQYKTEYHETWKIYPNKNSLSGIEAYIYDFDLTTMKKTRRNEINWYAAGSKSLKDTKLFIQALQKAVELCEAKECL